MGIGGVSPTNKLHVVPQDGLDPLRLEGLNPGTPADDILSVDADGVVHKVAASGAADTTNDAWVNNGTRVELGTLANGTSPRPAGTQFVALDNGNVGVGTATPTSNFQVAGSFSAPIRKFKGNVLATDYTIIGTGNVTLPSPVGVRGRIYNFVFDGIEYLVKATLRNDGDDQTEYEINLYQPAITVQSTGSVWIIISDKY